MQLHIAFSKHTHSPLPLLPFDIKFHSFIQHTIKFWDLRTRRVIQTLSGHRDGLKNVEMLPSASGCESGGAPQQLLSAAFDGTIRAWDLTQAAPLGRVVHTDRNLVRMRILPPGDSGTAAHGLALSMRDGALVLIHNLDVSAAATVPDSEPAAPSLAVLFDSGTLKSYSNA